MTELERMKRSAAESVARAKAAGWYGNHKLKHISDAKPLEKNVISLFTGDVELTAADVANQLRWRREFVVRILSDLVKRRVLASRQSAEDIQTYSRGG